MATCKIILDKRVKLKNNEFNLAIRVIDSKNQLYLNFAKLSVNQYDVIFNAKNFDIDAVEFREKCNEKLNRCEKIISEMKNFDREFIRNHFFSNRELKKDSEISLKIKDLFQQYIDEKTHLSISSIKHMIYSKNVFTKKNSEISILEIDSHYLKNIERERLDSGVSISGHNSNMRDLRTIINHFSRRKKILPMSYINPFGGEGYKICEYTPRKRVLTNDYIKLVLNYDKFDSIEQEYAKNIWEILYRCNGINFADLLRLKWENHNGNSLEFFRKKTENTRKNYKKEITVPINDRIEYLLDKVGVRDSLFVLGKLKEGYSETTFYNLNKKTKTKINSHLKNISIKLQLPVSLQIQTARDSYATVLKRSNKVTIDQISEMMGHSNATVTKHYLDSMDIESLVNVNSNLL